MWFAPIQSFELVRFGFPCRSHTHLCLLKWTFSLFNNMVFISWRIRQFYIWPTENGCTFTNSSDLSRSSLFAKQKLDIPNSNGYKITTTTTPNPSSTQKRYIPRNSKIPIQHYISPTVIFPNYSQLIFMNGIFIIHFQLIQ
jgi:hypothetical protein